MLIENLLTKPQDGKNSNQKWESQSLEERANTVMLITIDREEEFCIEYRFSRFLTQLVRIDNYITRQYYLMKCLLLSLNLTHLTFPFYITTILVFVIPN